MDVVINVTAFQKKETKNIQGTTKIYNKLIANENIVRSFAFGILDPNTILDSFCKIKEIKDDKAFIKSIQLLFTSMHNSLEMLTKGDEVTTKMAVSQLLSMQSFEFTSDYKSFFYFDFNKEFRLSAELSEDNFSIMHDLINRIFKSSMQLHRMSSVCNNESEIILFELKWLCIYYLSLSNFLKIVPSHRILMFASATPGVVLLRILAIVECKAISSTAKSRFSEGNAFEIRTRMDGSGVTTFTSFDGRESFFNSEFRRIVRVKVDGGQKLDMPDFIEDN